MQELKGTVVYRGTAMGPVSVQKSRSVAVGQEKVADAEAECLRLQDALGRAAEQLQGLYDDALEQVGEEQAAIFEVHQMMLEDEDYLDAIYSEIRENHSNAAWAVTRAGETFAELFASMDDAYMKERAADVRDISARLCRILNGESRTGKAELSGIILAEDLTPSETMGLEREKVLAFATVRGSANSHTAILARTMNLPALVGVPMDLDTIEDGTEAIIWDGKLILSPTEEQRLLAGAQIKKEQEQAKDLERYRGLETVRSGRRIRLYANIGSVEDVDGVLENDAEGIGLFRSEFLYLGRSDFPTEEEQFAAYRQVLERMGERQVIIRTLDIGADKQVDYLGLEQEANPAMGCRAIRICLERTDIFKTQLRALLRAAVYGNLSIMYPMIVSEWEVRRCRELVETVAEELRAEGIPCRIPSQGIMIETPAAVMISDKLAPLVDFFSIGTNDLTQYTLAIDRQNDRLGDFYDSHHEAVLRMIAMTAENGKKAGIWTGICGELAADLTLTDRLLELGIEELSVAAPMVLPLRAQILGGQ